MKKTLIALAVVAVSGTAFAQSSVTLSGKFGAAYQSSKGQVFSTPAELAANGPIVNSTTKTNGLAATDGDVVFAAVEDLGGGMKAAASLAVKVRGRGTNSIGGRDASVSLMGGFGTLSLGAIEAGNGIIGLASAGAPVIGQDNNVTLDGAADIDALTYTSPAFVPGLRARVLVADSITAPGAGGMQTAGNTTTDALLVGLSYSAGPVAVSTDFTEFGANSASTSLTDKRFRISGSYDLGVVKLGAGYQTKESFAGVKDNQFMLGISAPIGPVTVGATYAERDNKAVGNLLDAKGFELGANYAISKRTGVQAAYLEQKEVSGLRNKFTSFRIRLMHSF